MIDNIKGFVETAFTVTKDGSIHRVDLRSIIHGDIYCPKCGGTRRARVRCLFSLHQNSSTNFKPIIEESDEKCLSTLLSCLQSSIWHVTCLQCETLFVIVFYRHISGTQMVVLTSCNSGVVSPNTPPSVSYYLDQAYRARSVGANSACMAMYRAALDQLLFEQGYKEGMLGSKLKALEKDINAEDCPKWARDLNIDLLSYLNALGSGSIHPNDGDVEVQKELDNSLLGLVDTVFGMLLDKVYEQPKKEQSWLIELEAKKSLFEWKR